jgi:hypothetical protein
MYFAPNFLHCNKLNPFPWGSLVPLVSDDVVTAIGRHLQPMTIGAFLGQGCQIKHKYIFCVLTGYCVINQKKNVTKTKNIQPVATVPLVTPHPALVQLQFAVAA